MTKKISFLIALSLFSFTASVFAQKYKIDMKTIKDGSYKGLYEFYSCKDTNRTEINVAVAKNKITKIELLYTSNSKVKEISSEAFKMIIAKNNIEANSETMEEIKAAVYSALMQKDIVQSLCPKSQMCADKTDMNEHKMDMEKECMCTKSKMRKENTDMTDNTDTHDHKTNVEEEKTDTHNHQM